MANLEPELLRTFIAVADRGSFTSACTSLARSQSTVSTQITRLEQNVGASLFARTRQGVNLTPHGEILIGYARRLLALGEEAAAEVAGAKRLVQLRIGCVEDIAARVLPRAVRALCVDDPSVVVDVATGTTTNLLARLGFDHDLVIGTHPLGSGHGTIISTQPLAWIVANSGVTLLSERPFKLALHPQGCLYRRLSTERLDLAGIPWRASFVSAGTGAVEAAAREGLGASIGLERLLPADLHSVSARILPPLPSVEITVHVSDSVTKALGSVCDRLIKALGLHFAEPQRD